ncbi:MAG: hypothetical protein HXX20_06150 [Chloroflexi bacterium]|nr:hypothetical protein [Chloroflexota bacterium]
MDKWEGREPNAGLGMIECFAFDTTDLGIWTGEWQQDGRLLEWRNKFKKVARLKNE